MKKARLIINPSSGEEKALDYQVQAKEKLSRYFDEVDIQQTEKAGDAEEFAKEAASDHYHSVFVMGGDGTVNEVINGLAEQEHRPYFGFFPMGTVNDLARALNVPLNVEKAIDSFDFERTSKLDLGKINGRFFSNVVAIGAIPEGIKDVDPEEKTKLGKLAYFVSGFKQLSENQAFSFSVTADGNQLEIKSSTILIGLTNSIGGFEQLLPEAQIDDGRLHLIYLKDSRFIETVKTVPTLLKGVDRSTKNVGYQTAKTITVDLLEDTHLSTNVDGDEGDSLPVEVSVLPGHLTVYTGDPS
ncbi:diacylglycerol kinase [Enterococcus florum]|uniref:Diacylglycerol kinase n=1 Tax=Enterococcus florum TaxID=2480627 RepID=A0A4P5PG09_9ENTE|nr:diacylglycerol kinase family protein [Enterococcus florum]GCF95714.1 diacylglycerol kinase [Enterococcus florum]